MLARGVEQDLEVMILLSCVPRITATMGRTGRRFRTQAESKGDSHLVPGREGNKEERW